jgi:hypothetical protein
LKDALRLIDRHGGKIWLFTFLGEGALTAFWLAFFLVLWLLVSPSPEMLQKVFTAVYFPDYPEKLLSQIEANILGASPKMMALIGTVAALLIASVLFSVMGMMGLVRQAALEDRLTIGDFFSYGFRYLFRGLGLFLILSGTALLLGWGFLRLDSLAGSSVFYRVALWGSGGIVGLYVLAYVSFIPVVMLVERTGVFRSLGRVFRLFWHWPVRPVVTLLVAIASAVLGVVLLGCISAFPWLVLQFFPNETIAAVVGSGFGLLMLLTFHAFPMTHYMGTLLLAYVEMRERLNPGKRDREGAPLSSRQPVIWSRVQTQQPIGSTGSGGTVDR